MGAKITLDSATMMNKGLEVRYNKKCFGVVLLSCQHALSCCEAFELCMREVAVKYSFESRYMHASFERRSMNLKAEREDVFQSYILDVGRGK